MSTYNLAGAVPKQPECQPTAYMTDQRGLTEQDGCMLRCSIDTIVDHAIALDGVIFDFFNFYAVQSVCTHTLQVLQLVLPPI